MAIHATSADALLSYTLATSPTDPLNASTDQHPVTGRLDITVGRTMTTAAYCRKITVKIPIGAGAAELTTVNNDDIKQSALGGGLPEQGGGWTASATAEGNKRIFTFIPAPGRVGHFNGTWALTLTISQIPINKTVGKPVIEVIEESSPTNGSYTPKDPVPIRVDKAPPGFLFRNLQPSAIMVENGDPVTLTWEIQNGTCVMYWDDQSDPDVNGEPKWTSPALYNTTGFMLQATSAEDASFVHTLTTAVMVNMPDLNANSLRARHVEADALYAPATHLRHTVLDTATGDWSAPVWIPVATTDQNPSLASFGGRLRCSYFDGELRHWVGWDGKDWEHEELTLARRSRSAPAFSGPAGSIYCVYGDREDYVEAFGSSDGGLTWGAPLGLQRQWSSTSPLAWGKTESTWLFFLYRKPDDTIHFVYMAWNGEANRWESKALNDATSPFGVSAVGRGDDGMPAHCLLATEDGAMYLRTATYLDWGSPVRVADFRTVSKPALLAVAGKLYCFFRDSSGIRWTTSTNHGQSWSSGELVPGSEASTRAPAVAQHDGYLNLVF